MYNYIALQCIFSVFLDYFYIVRKLKMSILVISISVKQLVVVILYYNKYRYNLKLWILTDNNTYRYPVN